MMMKFKEGLLDYLTPKQQELLFWFVILAIIGLDVGLILGVIKNIF